MRDDERALVMEGPEPCLRSLAAGEGLCWCIVRDVISCSELWLEVAGG